MPMSEENRRKAADRMRAMQARRRSEPGVTVLEPPMLGQTLDVGHGYDLVFGIRKIRGGNFSGLWELSRFEMNEWNVKSHEVVVDADLKPVVIANVLKAIRNV